MENTSIIVVGAGIAGISAAVKLIEKGFNDVKILEASDRIGGRLHTVKFGSQDSTIDLGGQWVSAINEVHALVKDHFEFGDTDYSEEKIIFVSTGDETVDQAKYRQIAKIGHEIWEITDEMKNSEETFGEYFTRKFREGVQNVEGINEKLIQQMLHLHEREVNAQYASTSWHEIKAKHFAEGDLGLLALTWKKQGYVTLIDYVTKKLPDPSKEIKLDDKIHFNKKVEKISWNSDKIKLTCEDATEFTADHVILTIPHGVLKKHHQSMFSPPLPEFKVNAINAIEFGTLGKIFLEFEERIFEENVSAYSILWTEDDLKLAQSSDREWMTGIYGILHVDQYPNLVEIFVAGKHMLQFETMDDEKLVTDTMWLLRKLLKKNLNMPLNIKRTKWLTNDNFLGSYSFQGLTAENNTIENLAKPIFNGDGKPSLHFAGEATDKTFMGYVNGGLRSGERAAKEIIDFYG